MKSEEAYSILDIVSESEGQGVVLTRSGSICVSFELREPECYSLTPEDIDRRDGMFREAFKFLPEGTYVHKQDVFLKEKYCPDIAGGRCAAFPGTTVCQPYLRHALCAFRTQKS